MKIQLAAPVKKKKDKEKAKGDKKRKKTRNKRRTHISLNTIHIQG